MLATDGQLFVGVPSNWTTVQILVKVNETHIIQIIIIIIIKILSRSRKTQYKDRSKRVQNFNSLYLYTSMRSVENDFFVKKHFFPSFIGTFPITVTTATKACARESCCQGILAHRRPDPRLRVFWSGGLTGSDSTRHWNSQCPTARR